MRREGKMSEVHFKSEVDDVDDVISADTTTTMTTATVSMASAEMEMQQLRADTREEQSC